MTTRYHSHQPLIAVLALAVAFVVGCGPGEPVNEKVTKANLDKIKLEMKLTEVEAILGPGQPSGPAANAEPMLRKSNLDDVVMVHYALSWGCRLGDMQSVAMAIAVTLFTSGVLSAQTRGDGMQVLTGSAAFGDWRQDKPGVKRLLTPHDLPAISTPTSRQRSFQCLPVPNLRSLRASRSNW